MDFRSVKSITIPSGSVKRILIDDVTQWEKPLETPMWVEISTPSPTSTTEKSCKTTSIRMLYGMMIYRFYLPSYKDSRAAYQGLIINIDVYSTTSSLAKRHVYYTSNLNQWSRTAELGPARGTSTGFSNTGFRDPFFVSPYEGYLYWGEGGRAYQTYNKRAASNGVFSTEVTVQPLSSSIVALCYSTQSEQLIIVGRDGKLFSIPRDTGTLKREWHTNTTTTYSIGMPVNLYGVAWSPEANVFCAVGSNGTATSTNNQGTAWVKHTDDSVPKI